MRSSQGKRDRRIGQGVGKAAGADAVAPPGERDPSWRRGAEAGSGGESARTGDGMKTRKLGRAGPDVSALGYGCMGLNFAYGSSPERAHAVRLVRDAYERG